jgi:cell division cycle protein 20 (cofactor of APC complex)
MPQASAFVLFIVSKGYLAVCHFMIRCCDLQEEYKKQLAENLLRVDNNQRQSRILAFKSKPPPPPEGYENDRKFLYSQNTAAGQAKPRAQFRHIPQTAERTLDAPDLLDDYYLNLLDWSTSNVLAVALANTVYLWDATSSSIAELLTAEEDGPVTSVQWAPDGRYLAVGLNNADVQLWDSQELRQVGTEPASFHGFVFCTSFQRNVMCHQLKSHQYF